MLISVSEASDWTSASRRERERIYEGAVDGRDYIAVDALEVESDGVWLTPEIKADFAFDEIIYSWDARLTPDEGFRLYIRLGFDRHEYTPWIYAGFWGNVMLVEGRKDPVFEHGRMRMDQIFLDRKARTYQFKVEDEGDVPLKNLPGIHVVYTDNEPSASVRRRHGLRISQKPLQTLILDLPLRSQHDSEGNHLPNRCQSAALAAAMEYFGNAVPVEDIVEYTEDPEYRYPGIWPRTLGAAIQYGYDAYIDRFRTWEQVMEALKENKVILCSMTMPRDDDYINPPYPAMGGHIVALSGITDDGRVVVTDSAMGKSRKGYRCQWLREDFEKVWMRNKGGVGMVICPPPGAVMRTVDDLPPFPDYRAERERAAQEGS